MTLFLSPSRKFCILTAPLTVTLSLSLDFILYEKEKKKKEGLRHNLPLSSPSPLFNTQKRWVHACFYFSFHFGSFVGSFMHGYIQLEIDSVSLSLSLFLSFFLTHTRVDWFSFLQRWMSTPVSASTHFPPRRKRRERERGKEVGNFKGEDETQKRMSLMSKRERDFWLLFLGRWFSKKAFTLSRSLSLSVSQIR